MAVSNGKRAERTASTAKEGVPRTQSLEENEASNHAFQQEPNLLYDSMKVNRSNLVCHTRHNASQKTKPRMNRTKENGVSLWEATGCSTIAEALVAEETAAAFITL